MTQDRDEGEIRHCNGFCKAELTLPGSRRAPDPSPVGKVERNRRRDPTPEL